MLHTRRLLALTDQDSCRCLVRREGLHADAIGNIRLQVSDAQSALIKVVGRVRIDAGKVDMMRRLLQH